MLAGLLIPGFSRISFIVLCTTHSIISVPKSRRGCVLFFGDVLIESESCCLLTRQWVLSLTIDENALWGLTVLTPTGIVGRIGLRDQCRDPANAKG